MRFGWLTLAHSGSPDGDYGAIQDLVAQACFAEAAGFDEIWLTEHNFTGESVYCDPIPFASVVAARTSRIRIGFAVIQLALRHPIRLATELALLDNLSNGRLDVGVGHGTNFNEYEFVGFGLRSDDSRERMEETLDVMVRAWTESPLVYDGKFYHLRLPELRPRPHQRPYPPIWRSASSAASLREYGQLGAPLMLARIPLARVPVAVRSRRRQPGPGRGRADPSTLADAPPHGPRARNQQPVGFSRPGLARESVERSAHIPRGRRALLARDLDALRHARARRRAGGRAA